MIFFYLGGAGNFLPLWLDEAGWTEAQQGWLFSLRHIALVVFPIMWGRLADQRGPVIALRFIALGSAVCFAPLIWTTNLQVVMWGLGLFGIFRVGVVPVADAWTLRVLAAEGGSYGSLRMFGSLAFISGGLLLGLGVHFIGHWWVPIWLFGVLAALWLFAMWLTPLAASPRHEPPWDGLRRLLRAPELRPFLALALVYGLTTQGLYIFLPLHLQDLGVDSAWVPVYWSVGVASEIILFRLSPGTFERLAPRRTMLVCTIACVLQYGLTAVIETPGLLYAVMTLHGLTFGIFYYTCVLWLGRMVADADRATAQAIFQSTTFGIGGAVSAITSGYLFGAGRGPLLFGVAAALSLVMVFLSTRLKRGWSRPYRTA